MDDFIKTLASEQKSVTDDFRKEARDAQKSAFSPTDEDGFSFLDVLDIINPLQHIPVISTLYREATGDKLGPFARVAGGALFGGPIGAAGSVVNLLVEEASGKDIGGHIHAMLRDAGKPPEAEFETAAGEPFEAPAPGSLSVAAVTSETIAPPVPPASDGTDPVLAWARTTLTERDRRTMDETTAEAPAATGSEDPVTVWARREQAMRTTFGLKDVDPLADRDRMDPGKVATMAPDAGVLAQLHMARRETDSSQAALRESRDLGERGRDDRLAEAAAGLNDLGTLLWADRTAGLRNSMPTGKG
jgi:hypothetical protein